MSAYPITGRVLAGLAGWSVLLAGCVADSSGGVPGDGPGGGELGGPGAEAPAGLAGYLAGLPALLIEGENSLIQVAVADLDRAAVLAGTTRPAGSTDPETVRQYLTALSGVSADAPPVAAMFPESANPSRSQEVAEFAAEVGWSITDVSWFAEYQVQPDLFTVIGGDVDAERLTATLGERPEDGIWRLGGEDYEADLAAVSPARPIGQALRLALVDDELVVARSTPPVTAALTGGATLADHPELSALAAALDAEDAYSAVFFAGEPESFRAEEPPEASAPRLPEPFAALATGSVNVDGTPYAILAYSHADEAAAAANADALRTLLEEGQMNTGRPWREWFGVDDIRVDGTTVTARLTLREAVPSAPYGLLSRSANIVTFR